VRKKKKKAKRELLRQKKNVDKLQALQRGVVLCLGALHSSSEDPWRGLGKRRSRKKSCVIAPFKSGGGNETG